MLEDLGPGMLIDIARGMVRKTVDSSMKGIVSGIALRMFSWIVDNTV
jgi:hypothetical protein